jgi:hypothetical protein
MSCSTELIVTAIAMGTDGAVVLGSGATFGILMVWLSIHHISFYSYLKYKPGYPPNPSNLLLSRDSCHRTHDCCDFGPYQ